MKIRKQVFGHSMDLSNGFSWTKLLEMRSTDRISFEQYMECTDSAQALEKCEKSLSRADHQQVSEWIRPLWYVPSERTL